MPEEPPAIEWLSPTDAAKRLGVHPKTVGVWANEGRLTAYLTPGGHRRYRAEDIDALLKPRQASA